MTDVLGREMFAEVRNRLAKMPHVASAVADRAAPAFSALARNAFGGRRSVYGVAYGVGVGGPIDLDESGALKSRALDYEAHGTKVRASVGSVRYAKFMLKYGFLPAKGKLPVEWQQVLKDIADDELEKAAGG